MGIPTDAEKTAVWQAYHDRKPTRVPLRWNVNVRIILLNPALNPEGWTFEAYCNDPQVTLRVQARFQEYVRTTMSQVCDGPSELPEAWNFWVDSQNTYDGAYFGAPVTFEEGQCPSNQPNLTLDDAAAFVAEELPPPLENPWIRDQLAFHAELTKAAREFRYLGRGGTVNPFGLGFDGPVTIAAVLMGSDFFTLLGMEPELAGAFLRKLVTEAIRRNQALANSIGTWKPAEAGGLADDSIQLISTRTYEERVLPLHALWYDTMSTTTATSGKRFMHLCGDATRHFPLIRERLGVSSFDTGFPVDHGELRRTLGPEVEISGGPQVSLLREGTPEACAARAREILTSGIMEGGRFILQEGNNLPPCCPLANLRAVYETCREAGVYPA